MKKIFINIGFTFFLITGFCVLAPQLAFCALTSASHIQALPTLHMQALLFRAYRLTHNDNLGPKDLLAGIKLLQSGALGSDDMSIYNSLVASYRNSEDYKRYVITHGAAPEIVRVYRDVLDRDPDASGGSSWTQSLLNGASYNDLRAAIVSSPECQQLIKDTFATYQTLLPAQQQIDWATEFLGVGGGSIIELRHILSSQRDKVTNLAHLDPSVTQAYLDILDREPDWVGGIKATSGLTAKTLDLDQIKTSLLDSPEFDTITVDRVYLEIVGRPANPEDMKSVRAIMQDGGTINNVRATLRDSDECSFSPICNNSAPPAQPHAFYLDKVDFHSIFSEGSNFTEQGCNSVSYGSAPGLGNRSIGRVMNIELTNQQVPSCAFVGNFWSLSLSEMDWSNRQIKFNYAVFDDSDSRIGNDNYKFVGIEQNGDAATNFVLTAYDATVASFNGEYWVSFECGGVDSARVNWPSASACVGPLVYNSATRKLIIDPARTSLVVKASGNELITASASVPKLFVHLGHLYLYWTVVPIDMTKDFVDIAAHPEYQGQPAANTGAPVTRGTEVEVNPTLRRIYAKGHTSAISSDDDTTSVALLTGDIYQIISHNGHLLASGGITFNGPMGGTCSFPQEAAWLPNCYQIFFAEAATPLGGFQKIVTGQSNGIPEYPQQYFKFVYRPDTGDTVFQGNFPIIPGRALPFSSSNRIYNWPDKLLKTVCDPNVKPFPNYIDRGNECLPSCGVLGGHTASPQTCASIGKQDAGESYDAPYCCL